MFSHRTEWNFTPNRLTETHRELVREGREVLDLTLSNPTRAELPFDSDAILASLAHPASLDYDPQAKGLLSARQAVAQYYSAYFARYCAQYHRQPPSTPPVSPDSILLTTSTSEAYSYVFRLLCNPGDEVLVPKPSYPLFDFLADLQDVKLVPFPLLYDHGWQIDFPSLYKSVTARTRAVVLVHPNNPTGSYVHGPERSSLNDFCRQHNLPLIVDEVFLDYSLDGNPQATFATNQQTLTFTLSGISKISALPQMKLAWTVVSGPSALVQSALDRLEVIADTYLSMNAPIQNAAAVLLQQRLSIQPRLLSRVRANLDELDRQLAKQSLCERLHVEGGWYAILRVPVIQSDEDLAIQLLRQASVLIHPGHFYDFPRDGNLVLSLIVPPETFRAAVGRILQIISH
jgi:alanine-synthesizing transaminase